MEIRQHSETYYEIIDDQEGYLGSIEYNDFYKRWIYNSEQSERYLFSEHLETIYKKMKSIEQEASSGKSPVS